MANKRKWDIQLMLAVIWGLFTSSMVTWWWIWFLKMAKPLNPEHRMFAWEGSILLTVVLIGSIYLVIYAWRDRSRHERLKLFFSTFSHDIKTSITRLRLQAEVLEEEFESSKNPVLKRLLQDISRLDLQLENSLLLANVEDTRLFIEQVKLSQIIQSLRSEFSDLNLELSTDAMLDVDRRAFSSVLRNILHNSILHGKADKVTISTNRLNQTELEIKIADNGLGFKGESQKLGKEILNSQSQHSNGLGLTLSYQLINKMGGKIKFASEAHSGFQTTLHLKGHTL